MSRIRPADLAARPSTPGAAAMNVDELFPTLPPAARALLAEQPLLLELLLQLDRDLAKHEFTAEEVNRLAKRWSEEVPRHRGAIVYLLRHFLQPELQLGLPKPKAKKRTGKIKRQRRKPG